MAPCYKPLQIKPLSGLLDLRSLPEEVAYGDYRWVENVESPAKGKICRRPGFQRLLGEKTPYNNQDMHDQLFENPPQPISMLFEAISTTNVHRLLAATQNRIYALDDSVGNWKIISDVYGGTPLTTCSPRIFKAAQVEDIVVFTNGFDTPLYWVFDQSTTGSNAQSIQPITDLKTLNVTRAEVVFGWKGIMFLANVVADGVRVNHRIMWSDFRRPLSFLPAASSSLAGFHDLGYGEDILGIQPLNDSLLIYTVRGIWECQVGDPTAEIFTFRQRYSSPQGHGCLTYRNTLINTGTEHIYFSRDGIYAYNLYTPVPVRTQWIHKTSAAIFNEIDPSQCDVQVGGWNPFKKEAWFSWTKVGDTCPYRTLILNTDYQFADVMQRGFTAFTNYRPSTGNSIRDYLVGLCICPADGLGILGDNFTKEGGFCVAPPVVDCNTTFDSIYSTNPREVPGLPGTIEDSGAPDPGANSIYSALYNVNLDDLCTIEQTSDECNAAVKFLMASVDDNCIKQYGFLYGHELCTLHAGCGQYSLQGYESILRSGPIDYARASNQKYVRRFLLEALSDFQTIPSTVVPRLGFSHQASDPNLETCPIMWVPLPAKALACASPTSEVTHQLNNTQPYLALEWPTYIGGRFIYWEISIAGTGGSACFSSITLDAAVKVQGAV